MRNKRLVIVSLLVLPLLQGCIALAAGAVAGGAVGYCMYRCDQGKPPSSSPQDQKQQQSEPQQQPQPQKLM
jgi:uncharacterized membrane protein YebE (DUF533 family)